MKVEFTPTNILSFLSMIERDSIWTADFDNMDTEQGLLYKWAYDSEIIETYMEDDDCTGYREEYADLSDKGHKFLKLLRLCDGTRGVIHIIKENLTIVERVFDKVEFNLNGEILERAI